MSSSRNNKNDEDETKEEDKEPSEGKEDSSLTDQKKPAAAAGARSSSSTSTMQPRISLKVDTAAAEAAGTKQRQEQHQQDQQSLSSKSQQSQQQQQQRRWSKAGRKSGASTPAAAAGGAVTPMMNPVTPNTQDQHPYARGAVIEVWLPDAAAAAAANGGANGHNNNNNNQEESWWSETDSSEDENENNNKSKGGASTIRLCDIIDRAVLHTHPETGLKTWRYYIHYRDFNRRMDEWVTPDRIVSPPSVGNSKARALKREEEQRQRAAKRQREEAAAAAAATAAATAASGPRSRRRTSVVADAAAILAEEAEAAGGSASGGGRRTRLSRRKSTVNDNDDATVVASNETTTTEGGTAAAGDGEKDAAVAAGAASPKMDSTAAAPATTTAGGGGGHHNKLKEVVVVAAEHVTTHTVGEHTVATLQAQELDEHEGLDEASLREHEEVTKVKNVAFMQLGYHQMETWYFSPLPKELVGPSGFLEVLYVCEFTLSLFARQSELQRFQARLPTHARHPPGNEIYRKDNLAMFEIDGLEEKIYSQNLCYIAKLFLDHKTLYFDVDPFLFYVMCEVDDRGYHPVGYFSKEKYSDVGYNLACILTFPAHQRKGYGRFLIAFSYELSKKEEKVGSPEKPMSDLGQQAYKPYWASTIIDFLLNQSDESSLSVMDISKRTSIMAEDIVFTLNQLGLLKMMNGVYFVAAEVNLLRRLAQKYPIKEPRIDPTALHWTPFLTDIKRDKFSIHSKKASVSADQHQQQGAIATATAGGRSGAPTPLPAGGTTGTSTKG